MLSRIEFSNFRNFRHFSVQGLSRVNLFVGANNVGKSSVLEGIELLMSGGDPRILMRLPQRRGERIRSAAPDRSPSFPQWDISHLFFGHLCRPGAQFTIGGDNDAKQTVSCKIVAASYRTDQQQPEQLPVSFEGVEDGLGSDILGSDILGPDLALEVSSDRRTLPLRLAISAWGGISLDMIRRVPQASNPDQGPINFLGTDTLDNNVLGRLWDSVVLKPEEAQVIQSLQIIEPDLERIAFSSERDVSRASWIFVKLKHSNDRVPLGSMGDGLKRLLALSLVTIRSANGCVLIDEIDTGLHHSVMIGMWQMIIETAQRLNIQVFATTHSLDCVRALAWLYEQHPEYQTEVTLHRLERGLDSTIRYTLDEIDIAARQHMEIR